MEVNLITIEQVKENIELLTVKQYLPFAFKKKMIEDIIETCKSEDENGILHIDSIFKQMAFEYSVINQYTNIELSNNDIIETYDLLKESGLVKDVLNIINIDEIQFIEKCLNEQIDYLLKTNNSIEVFVAKSINKIIEKIPSSKEISKMIPKLSKELNKIDPEKMKYVSEVIGWNNGVNKKE